VPGDALLQKQKLGRTMRCVRVPNRPNSDLWGRAAFWLWQPHNRHATGERAVLCDDAPRMVTFMLAAVVLPMGHCACTWRHMPGDRGRNNAVASTHSSTRLKRHLPCAGAARHRQDAHCEGRAQHVALGAVPALLRHAHAVPAGALHP
jgi:hypothetical protein